MSMHQPLIIVGAGLSGSLLALRLAQRGFQVDLFERRADPRLVDQGAGRSINLALSARGIQALDRAGLSKSVRDLCVPMRGRQIHPKGQDEFLSPYSGRSQDFINSISRPGLNRLLIEAADEHAGVRIHFNAQVSAVDLKAAKIEVDIDGQLHTFSGQAVFGTDGAGSVVRRSMMRHSGRLLFNYEQSFLQHGYKELSIAPGPAEALWRIEREALHIWPRGDFMTIALPNIDGSFTVTMFHPYEGEAGFEQLDDPAYLRAFFEREYPSLLPHLPNLEQEYADNPVGTLGTIKCYPWQAYGNTLLMGDAAHAIVPFYGQGMNASFEDVHVFNDMLDKHCGSWGELFRSYQAHRKTDTDAIAQLALQNFLEMRDQVDDPAFRRKRQLEIQLEEQFSDYYSKYSLVTFRPELPYSQAQVRGLAQDHYLLNLPEPTPDLDQIYNEVKLL